MKIAACGEKQRLFQVVLDNSIKKSARPRNSYNNIPIFRASIIGSGTMEREMAEKAGKTGPSRLLCASVPLCLRGSVTTLNSLWLKR
jgi:hypothetical protein